MTDEATYRSHSPDTENDQFNASFYDICTYIDQISAPKINEETKPPNTKIICSKSPTF